MIQNAGTSSIKRCTRSDNLHPLLHPAGCIVPCIIVYRISHIRATTLIQGCSLFSFYPANFYCKTANAPEIMNDWMRPPPPRENGSKKTANIPYDEMHPPSPAGCIFLFSLCDHGLSLCHRGFRLEWVQNRQDDVKSVYPYRRNSHWHSEELK